MCVKDVFHREVWACHIPPECFETNDYIWWSLAKQSVRISKSLGKKFAKVSHVLAGQLFHIPEALSHSVTLATSLDKRY